MAHVSGILGLYDLYEHRCRKMLKVGRALKKVVRVVRAKNLGHAQFSLKPRLFCVHDTLNKSLLVEAMKK